MYKILSLFLMLSTLLFANIGTVTLLEGEAFVVRDSNSKKLNLGDAILNQDVIETKMNSKAKITFVDDTVITIGKESTLNIEDYYFSSTEPSKAKTQLSITKGTFHAITGQIGKVNPSKFKLKTKNATIGIRGTEFFGDETKVLCTKGAIFVESFGTIIEVKSGFFVNTFEQKIPSEVRVIEKQQLQELDSNLNTNSSVSLEAPSDFEQTSSPLKAELQTPIKPNVDNQESWGYWASNIQEEKSSSKKDNEVSDETNKPELSKPEPSKPEAEPTEPSKPEPSKPEPTEPSKPEPSKPEPTEPIKPDITGLTNVTYVQNLIDATSVKALTFNGKIDVPGITPRDSHINLTFKFGKDINIVNGGYGFNHAGGNYNGGLKGTINSSGFTASDINNPTNISGSFYGPEINSVAGSINLGNKTATKLNGTFDATRK